MKTIPIPEDPPIAGVNIVPVIDLCLVLLVILLITSPMLEQPNLPVKLPQAINLESKEKNISITYSKDGRIALNTEIIQENELSSRLAKRLSEDPDILVIVRVDKDANYGTLTRLLAHIKAVGAKRLAIGTEQKPVNR